VNAPASVTVERLDGADDDLLLAYHTSYVRAERADDPDAACYSLDDARSLFARSPRGWTYVPCVARTPSGVVGAALTVINHVDSGAATLSVWVPPEASRRGVGSALADRMLEDCRVAGVARVEASVTVPADRRDDHGYVRFAGRHGFVAGNIKTVSRLALPVDERLLSRLEQAAAPHHQNYRLLAVVGAIPPELAEGYCAVHNRVFVDAPTGALEASEGRRTPAVLADQAEEIVGQGRTRITAFALDRAGDVVGISSAVGSNGDDPHVDQWATIVRADHRGHRLGLAIKVLQTRTLQQALPEKRFVVTANAEANDHMVAINSALGFRPTRLRVMLQRRL
jgi:GNAT superfamily N-acetyltransferase